MPDISNPLLWLSQNGECRRMEQGVATEWNGETVEDWTSNVVINTAGWMDEKRKLTHAFGQILHFWWFDVPDRLCGRGLMGETKQLHYICKLSWCFMTCSNLSQSSVIFFWSFSGALVSCKCSCTLCKTSWTEQPKQQTVMEIRLSEEALELHSRIHALGSGISMPARPATLGLIWGWDGSIISILRLLRWLRSLCA